MTSLLAALLLLADPATDVSPQASTVQELRDAVARAKPGSRIAIAPGTYAGGLYFAGLRGEPGRPIVIAAADPKAPPTFEGGANGIHLNGAAHVELHDLVFTGATANGVSVDDGGKRDGSAHHLVLRNLRITSVGAGGNQDGIKLSGIDDFRVESCRVERWGAGGSGIDLVGCHRGVIEGNTFVHEPTAQGGNGGKGGNGVQTKGGSSGITIRRNRFEHAGSRAVNVGGSTGLEYFRPPLGKAPHAEAKEIVVEGNTIVGSDAAIAFAGVDGATVRFNTIFDPNRWAIRILQETTAEGFVPCRAGRFTDNLVAFRSTRWSEGGVNVGPGTEPASFVFARNAWWCVDDPARSRPKLPASETDGDYGVDPRFRDAEKGDLRLRADSPAKRVGADALERESK